MCGSDAMGEAGVSCCQSHRHPIHPTPNQAPAGKEEACETRLAQLQTPTTHPRPDERTPALWALHLLLISFICPPPAPALRLTPLPESSWAGSLMWSINLWKQDETLHASMNCQGNKKWEPFQTLYPCLTWYRGKLLQLHNVTDACRKVEKKKGWKGRVLTPL